MEGVFAAEGEAGGSVFDMDITTNRVDAMNHYGIAREAAAIYDVPLHSLDVSLPTPTSGKPLPGAHRSAGSLRKVYRSGHP